MDVLVARSVHTAEGGRVAFDEMWARRREVELEPAEVRSLVEWFRRRYPTPAERLAYVRRAYRRWAGRGQRR